MADARRCPYCHEHVPAREYRRHVAGHEAPLPDGQQKDHATLPPEERFEGDLEAVPTAYRHDACGVVTGMPEEIVRSYLADPFYISKHTSTFCCGCNKYVPLADVEWEETGQNVSEYIGELQEEAVRSGRAKPPVTPVGCFAAMFGVLLAPIGFGIGYAVGGWWPGAVIGAVVGVVAACAVGYWFNAQQRAKWDKVQSDRDTNDE